MRTMRTAAAVLGVLLAGGPLLADDEKKEPGLYLLGDLGFLWTSGNSKSNSLGLKVDLARLWSNQAFRFSAGALRQGSSPARIAVGTPEEYELAVPDPATTAEEYFARAAYDRAITLTGNTAAAAYLIRRRDQLGEP